MAENSFQGIIILFMSISPDLSDRRPGLEQISLPDAKTLLGVIVQSAETVRGLSQKFGPDELTQAEQIRVTSLRALIRGTVGRICVSTDPKKNEMVILECPSASKGIPKLWGGVKISWDEESLSVNPISTSASPIKRESRVLILTSLLSFLKNERAVEIQLERQRDKHGWAAVGKKMVVENPFIG